VFQDILYVCPEGTINGCGIGYPVGAPIPVGEAAAPFTVILNERACPELSYP
jgi:hypothetical protein